MKRIVVTGGAGFIASHLVARLIDLGYAVSIIDNLSTADPRNIHPAANFIQGSVAEPGDLQRLPTSDIQAVFHLAAQSSGEASFDDPQADFRTNVAGTLQILEWCRRHAVRQFIFTSSMAAYGASSDIPLDEKTPLQPKSFYGAAKVAAETYTRLFATFGLETTILRLFNVYGSRQNLANMKQGMASIYLSYLLKNEPIIVKGSLERFRDQTHVIDIIDALLLCLDNPTAKGKTYNIATGEKTTVHQLLDTMFKVSGKPANYPLTAAEGTPGDLFGCCADTTLARTELGWHCRQTLESGLQEMHDYFAGRVDELRP